MKSKMIQFAVFLMLVVSGILFLKPVLAKAVTYTESEIGTIDQIGQCKREAGGYSHVGVKLYWENKLVGYALDTHKKTTSYPTDQDWNYLASNFNGKIYCFTEDYLPTDSPIGVQESNGRFVINNDMIRNGRTDYSVIIEKIAYGQEKETYFEIANVPTGQYGTTSAGDASFQPGRNQNVLSSKNPLAASYIYHIYDARNIEPGAEIPANTGGGKMESAGKAYYNGSGYYLTKLPTVSYVKPGYTTSFLGWYSAATGGTQYKAGDILQKGNTLYARWSIKANQYNVTCVDVLGKDEKGTVLGKNSWKADCDAKVSGETVGTDEKVGAYYANCYYTGASTATVTASGATVYRYFSYESYPVRYIDQIESGSRKGEMLNSSSENREYNSNVSGADLGDDMEPGTYYKGYCYSNCTSAKVSEQGTTVYRYFRPVNYKIILDGNGATEGNMDQLAECKYDDTITLPKNLFQKVSQITLYRNQEKLSEETDEMTVTHKFLGWAVKPDGTVQYTDGDFLKNLTDCEETITLYAVWSEETVVPPNIPAQIGYQFLGWAKSPDAQTAMSQITVSGSTELYAIWKKDVVKYHVEYYKENLNGEYELTSNYEFESYSDEIVTLDSVDKIYPGFTLDEASSKLSGQVKADGSLILCVYYRRNAYELSYDLNGGKVPADSGNFASQKIMFGKSIVLSSSVPQREGYLFQGWSQEDNSSSFYQPGDSFVMQNHNVVLYAQWKPLSFTVKYDSNAAYSKLSDVSGMVPDTEYICQKDSYASEEIFQSAEAVMISWNSKPDGSGISVLPGTNMKGLFDSCKELTLYAVWKKDSSNTVAFRVNLWKEVTEQDTVKKEQITTLTLEGKPGEKISTALLMIYQNELQGEDVLYFYKGYEVVNTEAMEQVISLDSGTEVDLTVKERKCTISYQFDQMELENQLPENIAAYQEKIILPESLPNGEKIERFEDSMGNYYEPGSSITLEHNLQLYVQQSIHLHDESSKEKEIVVYVSRGKDYILPEQKRTGYRFLGWYLESGEKAGDPGDIIENIKKRCDYYAKWSEPLTYQISYDMGNLDVKILENKVSYYQYSKETLLPNADQVAVPEGYQFEGWYYIDDAEEKLITSIAATEYGDKVLKPRLAKKAEQDGTEENKKEESGLEQKEESQQEDNANQQTNQNTGNLGNTDDVISDSNSDKDSVADNKENIINVNRDDNSSKKNGQKEMKIKVGTVFWKGNLQYKVISNVSGKKYVKVVGNRCKSKKLSIPDKVVYQKVTFTVTEVGNKAFYQSKYITNVILSDSVVTIRKNSFTDMKKLKKVTIGKGTKKIEKMAFEKNLKLQKIVIKSRKLSKIGARAFHSIHPKAKIQVEKGKKKAYQKLLKASKIKKTVQIF